MVKKYLTDLMATFIRQTPHFKGKGRLIRYCVNRAETRELRVRRIPGGGRLLLDIAIPYEAMIWLMQEEQAELDFLKRLLRRDQTFVDGGANIGLWTLHAASRVGPGGRVIAFEPSPATFARLRKNVGDLTQVKIVNSALGSSNSQILLHCDSNHNVARKVDCLSPATVEVPCIALDSYLDVTVIHGIKLDVEGSEEDALRGAARILRQHQPWIIVEFNTLLAGTHCLGDWPVHNYLVEMGYVGWLCGEDALNCRLRSRLPFNWQANGYWNLFYRCPH